MEDCVRSSAIAERRNVVRASSFTWRVWIILLAALCAGCSHDHAMFGGKSPGRTQPFLIGADATWVLEDEADGATYFDKGVKKDPIRILRDNGFNLLRIRVFVDPKSERGYSRRPGAPAWGDTIHLLQLARRAKANEMKVLVDIMYCDSWADPEHQPKPAAWEKLPFDQLVDAAREHTRDVLKAMIDQGTPPAMVQVGNEITHGMLWPDARVTSLISSGNSETDEKMRSSGLEGLGHYDQLATVLKACIAEVRAADPAIRVVLHNHLGRSSPRVMEWLEQLTSRGVQFDILGFSCYAQGAEGDWKRTFSDVVAMYPNLDIMAVEYSAQKRYLNDLVYQIPGRHGLGTIIWEPTRHREALFDQNGKNAGGGQASNFVNDLGINQGQSTRPASRPLTRPSTSRPSSRPSSRPTTRPRHGGRYDTNAFIDLYPKMVRDFAD